MALKPDFAAALSARGALYYQQGKPEAAVADLESAAKLRPDDTTNLDRLGQTYLALDRASDAVRVLRRAAELEPGESEYSCISRARWPTRGRLRSPRW